MGILSFLKNKKTTDKAIFKKLGRQVFICNGIGFSYIGDEFLYDNQYLEVGFGRSTSGRGDWGGGFDYASTTPLNITIDSNFKIIKIETDSFYNSKESKIEEAKAKEIMKELKIGSTLIIEDEVLKQSLIKLFENMPIKYGISWDAFRSPHMIDFYLENKNSMDIRNPLKNESIK